MQPDPSVFLRGIRHEVIEIGHAGLSSGDLVRGITMLRSGEVLAHLVLRHESLPRLLAEIQPKLQALIEEICARLTDHGLSIPVSVRSALRTDILLEGEAVVARHDQLAAALSDCLVVLQGTSTSTKVPIDILMAKACIIILDFSMARDAALAAIRLQAGSLTPGEQKVPTDGAVTAHLRQRFPQYPGICATGLSGVKGFNTKEVYMLDLHGHPDWPKHAVMRRNREVDTVGNQVSNEFGILDHLHRRGIMVPRPLFADIVLDGHERPFIVMERLPGRSMSPSELGGSMRAVMDDLAINLAHLHRIGVSGLDDAYRPYGRPAKDRTLKMIDRFYRMWQQDKDTSSIILESSFIWLRAHADLVDDTLCIVHADYNLRNNLISDGRVSGMLDWELAHEGHPAEDLGYIRPQVEEVMAWPDFLKVYHDHGGLPVSDAQIRYFQIYGLAFGMATMAPACNGYMIGRHSDLLIGSAGTIEHSAYEATLARKLLAEVQIDTE